MRYGVHHAHSTDALAWLLGHVDPVAPEEYPVILSCRAALLAAHRERCERTLRGADVQVAMFNNRRLGRDLAVLARGGATALGILLDEYPTFPDRAAPFTDVLQMEGLTPRARAWVEASRHAVLATEAAVTSTSWTQRPDQAWQVVADIADSAQALVRLDARLSATNPAPLPDWATVLRFPAAELNLTSRHLGYVARSGNLDAAVDTTSRVEMRQGLLRVQDLTDIVDGARSLAQCLTTTRLSVPDLRGFSVMHSELSHLAAEALIGTGLEEIRGDYSRREERFREVAGMTARVRSLPLQGGGKAVHQTQELGRIIGSAVRRRDACLPGVLADLNEVYPDITAAVARGVTRALEEGRYLVVDDDAVELAWRRTRRHERPKLLWATSQLAESNSGSARTLDFVTGLALVQDARRPAVPGDSTATASRDRLRVVLSRDQPLRRPAAPNRRLSQRRL